MSIKLKLIVLVLIVLIPLITLQLAGIKKNYEENLREELESSIKFAQAIDVSFMNYLEESWTQQYAVGLAILANPQWGREEIKDYISRVFLEKRTLKGYAWISPEGFSIVSATSNLTGVNVQHMEFYQRIIQGEEKVVSNIRKSIKDDTIIIHIARGIYEGDVLKGIMLGIMDVEKLSYILNLECASESARFGLVDRAGMVVYRHGYPYIPLEEREVHPDSPTWRALKGEVVPSRGAYCRFDDENRLGGFYPITEIGWVSYHTKSIDEVLGHIRRHAKIDIAILILTSVVSLLLATILGNKYTNSIMKLRNAAEEIARGNLTIKTELTGEDEIAVTSQAFNRMAKEINYQISQRDEIARLKTQFFSTVSHELKTPINIILGAVQLMENMDNMDKESKDKYINMQKQNSYRLLRLINNLIDINKIEGKQFTVNFINCDIVKLAEDITMSVVEYTKLKDIELIFDTDVEEKMIAVDPDKIERILLNLLSNAIKFTEAEGRIEVSIHDKEDTIEISVKDDGIGIPKEMHQSIFRYFTQVDGPTHRKAEGSGIGLSLVKSLVHMHKGRVKVESVLGEGSEFTVELPVRLVEDSIHVSKETTFANVERINIEFSDIYT
ncbi:sensor histidine kinase [Clostridium aceticum]|nr:sensor histidine kinase [Clostridium aceticum]